VYPFYQFSLLSKEKGLLHAVSKKEENSPYAFSMALHTGEDQEKIVENRRALAKQLSIDDNAVFVVANQTHSDHITVIKKREIRGWEGLDDAVEDCDALITNLPDVILTILTADCVPILLYDPSKRVVAAVHAGWRGTKARIAAKTIQTMEKSFGSDPSDIIAGVAPAIGKCCYEVGDDVASHFGDNAEEMEQNGEKFMLDLPMINKKQMLEAGIAEDHIEMSDICTACETSQFFSYRKEKGCSGRFMSMIGLRYVTLDTK